MTDRSSSGFEVLTHGLGAVGSRREALRLLGRGGVALTLAMLGVSCARSASNRCSERSSCGERVYTNDEETCICIETAEAVLVAAQLPTGCDLHRCTTSADCAHLGDDWFCDAPASGCCSEDLQYCVAPCGESYENMPPPPPLESESPDDGDEEPEPDDEAVPAATEPLGLHLANPNEHDVLFLVGLADAALYFHGPPPGSDGFEVHWVTVREYDGGETSVVVLNEQYVPIQWMLDNGSITVRRDDPDEPLDPTRAQHAFLLDGEQVEVLDISPTDLPDLIALVEEATSTSFDDARAVIEQIGDTYEEVVERARTPGDEQPAAIMAAVSLSTAAAWAAMDRLAQQEEADTGDEETTGDEDQEGGEGEGAAPAPRMMPVSAVVSARPTYSMVRDLAEKALTQLAEKLLNDLAEEYFEPKPPQDPNDPSVDVLLCQGATLIPEICHYMFFINRGSPFPCLDVCITSLGCHTNICMPMTLRRDDVQNVRGG